MGRGIDLIVIYNSRALPRAGRGSLAGLLAYGNANDIVVDMAPGLRRRRNPCWRG